MNMAQATEFWSHCSEHFVSILHCRVCVCGSYGGDDIHEGGGGRMYTKKGEGGQLKKCFHYPINRMRCWKVGFKVLAVTSCYHGPPPSRMYSSKVTSTM